jgi:hypothetical protein
MDLTFYDEDSRYNSGFMGLLCLISINTRYVHIIPIKNKSAQHITDLFRELL